MGGSTTLENTDRTEALAKKVKLAGASLEGSEV